MTARETKPTPAALWERAGYLRAAYSAADAAYASAADAAANAAADADYAYDAADAAYAAADADADHAAYVDAYEAGKARWAREHP